jgi:membrane associated rhomboid family serine protease
LYSAFTSQFTFEQSISKFYGGVVSFRVSELDKTKKSFLVIFSLLSGLLTYLILNFLLSFLIPVLGPLTKIFASIFGLCIAIPVWVKVGPEKGERILFL